MQIVKLFRTNARIELERQGKSQADVARDTSLTIKQVYSLFNPSLTNRLDFSYAMLLAEYLGVSIYSLIGAESSRAEKELKFKKIIFKQKIALERLHSDHTDLMKKFDAELKEF
tara:strand:+ start:205 stop:546 length:342 start_codon:yes stop_codon:yes gene_type:complete